MIGKFKEKSVPRIDCCKNMQVGRSRKGERAREIQNERMQLQRLYAIGITSPAEPHFAAPETALFPVPISSAAISEEEKMTIEL